MYKPTRYLNRMMAFIVAVLGLSFVLFEPLKLSFMANTTLNGVIITTLIIGIVFAFRQVIMLKAEISWVAKYRRENEGFPDEASKKPDGPEVAPHLLAPMAALLAYNRAGAKLSALSMRSLLDSLASRLDEGREISRYMIGLLIFLGLLGTFWGLLGTIGSIGATIKSLSVVSDNIAKTFEDLKAGLQTPLAGMATAFSSSLFGLAGSIILGFLDLQAGQAQNRFYNDLEEWLSTVSKLSSAGVDSGDRDSSASAYISVLLEQSADSLDKLQRIIGRSDEGRKQANDALLKLSEQLALIAEQTKTNQAITQKLVEVQNQSGLDDASKKHLSNIDFHLKKLGEDTSSGQENLVKELRGEFKLLARTFATIMDEKKG
jgi:biopolymer transport protein ExbB/TolQ